MATGNLARPLESAPQDNKPDAIAHPASVRGDILWLYAISITVVHLLALLAFVPLFFSWTGLVLAVGLTPVFGQSITICYHRLLAHRSFKAPKWFERSWVLVSLCCLQDTPAKWVANHRLHHSESDHQPDPHSPFVSFLWSHIGWLYFRNDYTRSAGMLQKYAKDILQDPFYMYLEKSWAGPMIYMAHVVLFYLVGFVTGYFMDGSLYAGFIFGMSVMIWGAIVRTVLVWHITWSVNSLTHIFGYRTYRTDEGSRNNFFVTLLTFGEGWHNNHHYDQTSASMWHRWWEVDMNYIFIRFLEKIGLARNVIMPKHVRSARRKKEIQSTRRDRLSVDAPHSTEMRATRGNTVKNHIENSINCGELTMHQTPTETRV
ncbi:MAG: acyl-CoA desaturase [Planctomycetaceae bacterium]|nr:acyl-CoA desaturase [Planctomycetaceae bacterium]|tara:strand:+ start:897 stop:2015 length:1119 start_codon:yes stop_codon:yes gene_type:complete